MRRTILAVVFLTTTLATGTAGAVSIQVLSPGGSLFGTAYDIDGNNVVGTTGSVGFLYDGSAYTKIFYPGSTSTVPFGISGSDIVGFYRLSGSPIGQGFLYDGSTYSSLKAPFPGTLGTVPADIDGNNIVGSYGDAAGKVHSFLYDGSTWSSFDFPLAKGTYARGIDGSNIVGYYIDASDHPHGFVYDGTTWTTLDDSLASTAAYGISDASVVGTASSGSFRYGYLYADSQFTHPLNFTGYYTEAGDTISAFPNSSFRFDFYGISGNKIVGSFTDQHYGIDRPFILTIPEPSTFLLAMLAAAGLLLFVCRKRPRASPRFC